MSGFDRLGISLGIHHVESATNAALTGNQPIEERLANEMKTTFDVSELTRFFAGFGELSASDVYAPSTWCSVSSFPTLA